MTDRQRALHRRLREEMPELYQDVSGDLSVMPLGTTVRVRLPQVFHPRPLAEIFTGSAILVTRTPRGLEYVDDGAYYRKGWTRPRPRLLPMVAASA